MNISQVAHAVSQIATTQHSLTKTDPDGGADRAQELGNSPPSVHVRISQEAQQLLAANIANDADHGLDGK